jgi:hypothetical protein
MDQLHDGWNPERDLRFLRGIVEIDRRLPKCDSVIANCGTLTRPQREVERMIASIAGGPPAAIQIDHEQAAHPSSEVTAVVRGLALELVQHTEAIATEVTRRAVEAEPALVDPDDPTSQLAASHSTEANVGAILSTLAYGVPAATLQPPEGALELYELLADRDDGLTVILRGYRLGIRELWQIWAAFVASRIDEPELLHGVLAASTSHMLTYVDEVSERLVSAWTEVRRRHRQGASACAEHVVRRVLFGNDRAGAGLDALGYPVAHTQIAAALGCELENQQLDSLVRRLRDYSDASVIAARIGDSVTIWLAFGSGPSSLQLAAAERLLAEHGPVGLSEAAAGVDGFRAASREAADARRIAVLRAATGVTHYRDVALLAVLCADSERARALALAELGPLAGDDEASGRLRETVATFLACGESHVAAAAKLFVHQKTVAYRVRQAESILGRKLTERRTELEAALLVHRALTGAA